MKKQEKLLDTESIVVVEDPLSKFASIILVMQFFIHLHYFSTHTNDPMQDIQDNSPCQENDTPTPSYENDNDTREANDPRNNSHIKDRNAGEVRENKGALSKAIFPVRTENCNSMDNEQNEDELDEANHPKNDSHRKVILSRVLTVTSFIFEILTIIFEQLSSPHKSHYAIIAMVTSFIAMVVCVVEIAYRGRQEKVTWRRRGNKWWFYNPPPSQKFFCSPTDIFGLISVILQFICTTIAYILYCRNVDNPINMCMFSLVFTFCLFCSKYFN